MCCVVPLRQSFCMVFFVYVLGEFLRNIQRFSTRIPINQVLVDAAAGCMDGNSSATVIVLRSLPPTPRSAALRRHAAAMALHTLARKAPSPPPRARLPSKQPESPVDVAQLLAGTRMAVDEPSTRAVVAACRDSPDRIGLLDLLAACDLLALLCAMQRRDDAEGGARSTALVTAVVLRVRERITALRQRKTGNEGFPDEVLTIVNGLNATEKALVAPVSG